MTDDWSDAFNDDEAAERERRERRAERRRRRLDREGSALEGERRQSLGERVRERLAAAEAPPQGAPARTPPSPVIARRRAGAVVGLAVLVAVVLGVIAVANRLGGDAPAPAAPKAPRTASVTIPEGLTREQIAETATEAGVRGDYEQASKSSRRFDLAKYGAKDAESLEGFLFPATYELFNDATAEDLVAEQLAAFEKNVRQVDMDYAHSRVLTPYDVLIIASMIEREVSVANERDKVAAVIYNRLSQGVPLGIDATIRFATGNYDKPLTESELAVESPYNTRVNAGLPPGPIGNPGLDSIEAAANPARVDYLYYVIKPGTCNEHFFTASSAEFDQAAAEYQAALEAEGGSPTDCE